MYEILKEFTFEAAHHLALNVAAGHPYARLHGHSFMVEVYLRGEPDRDKNWLYDFGETDKEIVKLRAVLDYTYLNDIDGLAIPTPENISRWIWRRLQNELPGLDRVVVRRGSCGEGCVYSDRAA
jgi:6-pyruvoyltetrahydropterin/6-carboxytetrahydropterin synthase